MGVSLSATVQFITPKCSGTSSCLSPTATNAQPLPPADLGQQELEGRWLAPKVVFRDLADSEEEHHACQHSECLDSPYPHEVTYILTEHLPNQSSTRTWQSLM